MKWPSIDAKSVFAFVAGIVVACMIFALFQCDDQLKVKITYMTTNGDVSINICVVDTTRQSSGTGVEVVDTMAAEKQYNK